MTFFGENLRWAVLGFGTISRGAVESVIIFD